MTGAATDTPTPETTLPGHARFAEEVIREHVTDGKGEWVLGFFRCALQEARGLGFREGNDLPAGSTNPHLIEHDVTDDHRPTTTSVTEALDLLARHHECRALNAGAPGESIAFSCGITVERPVNRFATHATHLAVAIATWRDEPPGPTRDTGLGIDLMDADTNGLGE